MEVVWKRPEDCLLSRDTRDDLNDKRLPGGSFFAFAPFPVDLVDMVAEEVLENPAILLLKIVSRPGGI